MTLTPCTSCGRHHRATDPVCPFCGVTLTPSTAGRPRATKALHLIGGAVTTVVLAACYGTGGFDDFDTDADFDGDGYSEFEDCDDADSSVYPGAEEVCDDSIDNDCDADYDAEDADCASE